MSSSSVDPAASLPRMGSAPVIPWLLSTAVHAGLLVTLALHWSDDFSPPANRSLGALDVTFVSPTDRSEHETAEPVTLADSSSGELYYDDEPPLPPVSVVQPSAAPAGSLASLLNEKPAVNLAGVLPSAVASASPPQSPPETSGASSAKGPDAPGRLSNRLRGGETSTSVFGALGEGRKFVYVFDRSGSMDGHGGAPLRAAKSELVNSLKDLGQTHQFQIIFYNERPRVFNPTGAPGRLVFGNDQNKYLAQKFVGSITADGATRHEEALEAALKMSPDVIFFLTDADEPRLTEKQLARIAHLNAGTVINAIEFGYGAQTGEINFLVKLARQNGGQHVYVDLSRLTAGR